MRVEAYRPHVPGPWWWRLSLKNANTSEHAELGDLGGLAENTANLTLFECDECKNAKFSELGGLGRERVRVTI